MNEKFFDKKFAGAKQKVNTTNSLDPTTISVLANNNLARETSSQIKASAASVNWVSAIYHANRKRPQIQWKAFNIQPV